MQDDLDLCAAYMSVNTFSDVAAQKLVYQQTFWAKKKKKKKKKKKEKKKKEENRQTPDSAKKSPTF